MNYIVELADEIRAEVPTHLVPPNAEDLFLLYAVLARSRGASTTAENVHDAWTAWMTQRGEEHEAMVPFAELSDDVRQEDEPFAAAIRRVAARRSRPVVP